jgi:hypothetical protein
MTDSVPPKVPLRTRIAEEAREIVVVALYLYVCFAALAYLKAAILQAHGIAYAPFGVAVAKALICAKFISLGRMLKVGERFKGERRRAMPLIWPTLYKSLSFLVLLLFLNSAEEIVVGLMHDRSVADSVAEVGGGTYRQLVAVSFVTLLILIPFFAFRALGEAVGERNLVSAFFGHRGGAASG